MMHTTTSMLLCTCAGLPLSVSSSPAPLMTTERSVNMPDWVTNTTNVHFHFQHLETNTRSHSSQLVLNGDHRSMVGQDTQKAETDYRLE